jgi:1,4-alpha-glucan branching enzyme
LTADETAKVLVIARGPYFFLFNFHPTRSYSDFSVRVPPGRYVHLFDSDETRFDGQGRIAPHQVFTPETEVRNREQLHFIRVYLPQRTALVLKRQVRTGKRGAGVLERNGED